MNIYIMIIYYLLGSSLASFYGVVATRLPENKSIVKPGSHCDYCSHKLSWYELIPVFSYLFLRGKCRKCHKKLPIYEPIMEFITGLLFAGAFYYYGYSYNLWASWILISLFDLIYISDLKYMIILDSPLVISGILLVILRFIYNGWQNALLYIGSGIVLFLFMLFVGYLGGVLFHREALGGGDVKLAFIMGLALGIPHGFLALILSTFLALPYATLSLLTNSNHEVPYGPFLVSALCLVFYFYDKFSYVLQLLY